MELVQHRRNAEKYAEFWMVTFGNPRPTNIPKSERARAMDALFRYRFHGEGKEG